MKLAEMTWQEVEALSRDVVVLIPTGSLEQHGPHLALFTDTLLATAVAESVESRLSERVLLTPALWLGASGHHIAFPGTLSASFEAYIGALTAVCESLIPHGFWKFYALNGHGGNSEPNGIAMRSLKARHPEKVFGHAGYFGLIADQVKDLLEGPTKEMRHACEAEASLMLHLHPRLVRSDKLRDDGLKPEPAVKGIVHHFDELTEQGSLGHATYASADKGKRLFELAVNAAVEEIRAIADGYVLIGEG